MGQTGFCTKNLQFAAVFCASDMLQFPGRAKIRKKSAKICKKKTANLAPFVPFSLSLLVTLEILCVCVFFFSFFF